MPACYLEVLQNIINVQSGQRNQSVVNVLVLWAGA